MGPQHQRNTDCRRRASESVPKGPLEVRGPVAVPPVPGDFRHLSPMNFDERGAVPFPWSPAGKFFGPPPGPLRRAPGFCGRTPVSREPKRRISSFSSPAALSSRAAFRELEQISSMKPLAQMGGRVLCRLHFPQFHQYAMVRPICQAASQPARPAPQHLYLLIRHLRRSFPIQLYIGPVFFSPAPRVHSSVSAGFFPSKGQSGVTQYRVLSALFSAAASSRKQGISPSKADPRRQNHIWDIRCSHRTRGLFSISAR